MAPSLSATNNLGYYQGPQDPVDAVELLSASEEFPCDQGLAASAECDAPTLAKLRNVLLILVSSALHGVVTGS